jgi:hypothetical protein
MRLLLNHFAWDREKLLEAYFQEDGNQEKLFKDAKIVNPSEPRVVPVIPQGGVEDCLICYSATRSDVGQPLLCLLFFVLKD